MKYEKLVKMFNSTLKMRETILSIYIYKIEAFEPPTIFHVSTILKKKKKKNQNQKKKKNVINF